MDIAILRALQQIGIELKGIRKELHSLTTVKPKEKVDAGEIMAALEEALSETHL